MLSRCLLKNLCIGAKSKVYLECVVGWDGVTLYGTTPRCTRLVRPQASSNVSIGLSFAHPRYRNHAFKALYSTSSDIIISNFRLSPPKSDERRWLPDISRRLTGSVVTRKAQRAAHSCCISSHLIPSHPIPSHSIHALIFYSWNRADKEALSNWVFSSLLCTCSVCNLRQNQD